MILKPARLLVILLTAAAVPAFAQNAAVVNGKPIPSSKVDEIVKQVAAQGQQDSPQLRAAIREKLIDREVMVQEAEKSGVANSPEVKAQLENARQSILLNALATDYLKKHPVKDADMKAEYDKFKAQSSDKEYHARHILVDKEEDAKAIIAKLKAGAKFEDLAKQSKDPGSAPNGGDLDWAAPSAFVKPFSDAMVALKKGEYTQTPVKTQFGWHVIKLDDVRAAKVPTFDEVKPQIAEQMQRQRLQAYEQELRSKAKVQ